MEQLAEFFGYLLIIGSVVTSLAGAIYAASSVEPPGPASAIVEQQESDLRTGRKPEAMKGRERERVISAWASRCRLISVSRSTQVQDAAQLLLKDPSQGLLVVDRETEEIVGMLQERDLVRALGAHGERAGRMRVEELVGSEY